MLRSEKDIIVGMNLSFVYFVLYCVIFINLRIIIINYL